MAEYKLLKTEGRAKRAEFHTVHGTIQTPVFMNVGTIGAIKGAVSTMDLQQVLQAQGLLNHICVRGKRQSSELLHVPVLSCLNACQPCQK